MNDPPDEEIAYGVEIRGVYDGVLYWVMKDGTLVNRWEPPGRLSRVAEEYMAKHRKNLDGKAVR